jgi:hypothetical protein
MGHRLFSFISPQEPAYRSPHDDKGVARSPVIYPGKERVPMAHEIEAVPLGVFCATPQKAQQSP